ncbi:MAG: cell division protein FtsH [Parcubacteria group bacterium GW2011_GWA2_38_13b]|nr:MAG: cell division protein FtsH [Parcubacteria group bacterium GW2011_GWA2_38_13b]
MSAIFTFYSSEEKPQEVGLSKLVEEINQEQVVKIIIKDNDLEIELRDGTKQVSKKERESSLTESLKNYGVEQNKLNSLNMEIREPSGIMFWIGSILPIVLPFVLIIFFFWFLMRQARQGSMQAFSFGESRARFISPKDKKGRITFKDVAGLEEAKEELKEIVDFLKNPKKYTDIGAKIPKGVLLMGSPGTGKTLLAKAVAGEADAPFFNISGSEFVEMFVGVGASRVRDLFKNAKKNAPAIVFIDEIDAVGRQRGTGLGGGHDEREQTLNQILVEMDGFDTDTNVIVMAATNRPDVLDPALLRPGRFDRRVVLENADIKDREAILKIHSRNKPLDKMVDLRKIAERTPGFSGADLENLINEAAILTARKNKKIISQQDILSSIEKVLLGPERKSHILSVKEKEIAAFHEAGHALVAASLPNADPVHKVSIISRGRAAGYTLKLPIEDKQLYSRSYFLDELAVLLGGYTSEKLIFNELTTGASNDLQKASEIARKLVRQYGMSEKIGPVTFGENEDLVFLGREIGEHRNYSEEIASKIDREVTRLINNAQKTAKKILSLNKEKLEKIARELIEKEMIEQKEFNKLIKE